MEYVKMPAMLSPEVIKALQGNVYTIKNEPSPKDEMAAAWEESIKEDEKCDKKEEKKCEPQKIMSDEDCCCPKKVKFIFVLNNTVIINLNAVCEEDRCPT